MTVLQTLINYIQINFSQDNLSAGMIHEKAQELIEAEEAQIRDDFNAGYRFAKNNGQDFEEYINHLKAK